MWWHVPACHSKQADFRSDEHSIHTFPSKPGPAFDSIQRLKSNTLFHRLIDNLTLHISPLPLPLHHKYPVQNPYGTSVFFFLNPTKSPFFPSKNRRLCSFYLYHFFYLCAKLRSLILFNVRCLRYVAGGETCNVNKNIAVQEGSVRKSSDGGD